MFYFRQWLGEVDSLVHLRGVKTTNQLTLSKFLLANDGGLLIDDSINDGHGDDGYCQILGAASADWCRAPFGTVAHMATWVSGRRVFVAVLSDSGFFLDLSRHVPPGVLILGSSRARASRFDEEACFSWRNIAQHYQR